MAIFTPNKDVKPLNAGNGDDGVKELLAENNTLLRAILIGIEIIADQENGSLFEDASNEE